MRPRTRTRVRSDAMGQTIRPTTGDLGPYPFVSFDAQIDDFIEKGKRDDGLTPPSPLVIFARTVNPPGLTYYQKHKTQPLPTYQGYNLPCSQPFAVGPVGVPPSGWASIEPSDEQIRQRGLSNSNPLRYEVSVPVMVAELIETASLFAVTLTNLSSAVGSTYLNVKFGWMSLISDIESMTKLLAGIESRIKEFNSLIKKGGVRRKVSISKKAVVVPFSNRACFSNSYSTWYSDGTITYSSKVWLTVRWRPQRDKMLEVQRLVASREELLKILLGFKLNRGVQVWEAIPFTWLVDYFTGLSETLQAIENSDLVVPFDICVMRERRIQVSTHVRPKSRNDTYYGYSYASPGTVDIVMKRRETDLTSSDAFHDLLRFGILTPGQAQTIMALLLSRRKGRTQL